LVIKLASTIDALKKYMKFYCCIINAAWENIIILLNPAAEPDAEEKGTTIALHILNSSTLSQSGLKVNDLIWLTFDWKQQWIPRWVRRAFPGPPWGTLHPRSRCRPCASPCSHRPRAGEGRPCGTCTTGSPAISNFLYKMKYHH